MNLDVNYRVKQFLTLRTMTVLPGAPVINLASGVSAKSSQDWAPGGTDVNRLDVLLSQQGGHHLDL